MGEFMDFFFGKIAGGVPEGGVGGVGGGGEGDCNGGGGGTCSFDFFSIMLFASDCCTSIFFLNHFQHKMTR